MWNEMAKFITRMLKHYLENVKNVGYQLRRLGGRM